MVESPFKSPFTNQDDKCRNKHSGSDDDEEKEQDLLKGIQRAKIDGIQASVPGVSPSDVY